MNTYQIIGSSLSLFATIFIFLGSYQQVASDANFKKGVNKYVEEQNQSNIPNLVATKILGSNPNYKLVIKNNGKQSASKVKLIYSVRSTPRVFANNMVSEILEIPNDTETELPLNLFSGIEMMMLLPNDDKDYKNDLISTWNKFKTGQIGLIPRFYLEYYYENKRMFSDNYFLVVDSKNGIVNWGKE